MSALPRLHLDWETRSQADLAKIGMYAYCQDETTSIWLGCYRFEGDKDVATWLAGQAFPDRVINHVAAGGIVVAHNAAFERCVWNHVLPRQLGTDLPKMTIEQMDCTMARALAMGMPGGLGVVAAIVGAEVQKDMQGASNMKRMAKPRSIKDGVVTWWDEPERIERLKSYCIDDVRAEEGVDLALPALSKSDLDAWRLDQYMNERGIFLDREFAHKAQDVVDEIKDRLGGQLGRITSGEVTSCTKRQAIVDWLIKRGHPVNSLAKGVVGDVLDGIRKTGDTLAEEAVLVYCHGNKSSTSKFKKMEATVNSDSRSRGTVQWHGAFTGRWSGRLWQPQNLKRIDETALEDIKAATHAIMELPVKDAADFISMFTDDPLETISICLRSVVRAAPGNILIGADYSNVEGRLIAWLAGAEEKLEAFSAQDRGEGFDLYNLSYAASFGIDPATMPKKGPMRQIGKVQELALGYQGSVGAYMNMAAGYGIKPEQIAETVLGQCSQEDYDKAAQAYKQPGCNHFDLDKDVWIGLKIVVNLWRSSSLNRDVAQFWWDLQDAALAAVTHPGTIQYVGKTRKIAYVVSKGFMWCRLPTGKILAYCNPRVRVKKSERMRDDGTIYEQTSNSVEYDGWDGATRRWGTIHLYGGLQANHVTQGTAAEIMKRGMKNLEAGSSLWGDGTIEGGRKFPCVLTVHDEAMAEIPMPTDENERNNIDLVFKALMVEVGTEFKGLPLAASGWMDERYVK